MLVLGISAFYHDSAAAIVKDGRILAAAQEERFSRNKHESGFPWRAVSYCLHEAGVSLDQLDYVGFYDKPILTFDRLLETYLASAPKGLVSFAASIPTWVKDKIFQKAALLKELNALGKGQIAEDRILFDFHHHSHAAASFYPSPFDKAAILIMDGVGEWATTTMGIGDNASITLLKEIRFPHSLGLLYSAFTTYLGFTVNDGEYKVMGLAPYGEPRYVDLIRDNLIEQDDDGGFSLNMLYFGYCTEKTMTNAHFHKLFGGAPRGSSEPLTQRHMDIARSLQVVLEDVVLKACVALHRETGMENLCLGGGVALNCVANGRILRDGPFKRLWIQPASGDAGSALGVALAIDHIVGKTERVAMPSGGDRMQGTYLGPAFGEAEVRSALDAAGAKYRRFDDGDLTRTVVEALQNERVIGWFQGRMEFGPRALGNRSIIADARSPKMQRLINLKVKYRESFRPFAPAVLREDVSQYFELDGDSPYMLLVADVARGQLSALNPDDAARDGLDKLKVIRSTIPAVTHVDNSARVQTVSGDTNPKFYGLIQAFKAQTGCGVLINTSFNVRDEPIVCSPADAYNCFMASEIDMLVIGNMVLIKEEQR